MKYTVEDLKTILIKLRSNNGCAWDREQTHQSIKRSMIEEAYEAIEALDNNDDKMFANELGDVLLQVVFNARIAEERGAFSFDDVVNEICTKLVTRHTHVFGADSAQDASDALNNWEKNKKTEKGLKSYSDALVDVPKNFPALIRAEKVQKKAKSAGFDWDDINGPIQKIYEETEEIKEIMDSGDSERISEEFGDLLFSVVNFGRFLKVDPETALTNATNKFIDRFKKMEEAIKKEGYNLNELSLNEMDNFWNKIKENE